MCLGQYAVASVSNTHIAWLLHNAYVLASRMGLLVLVHNIDGAVGSAVVKNKQFDAFKGL